MSIVYAEPSHIERLNLSTFYYAILMRCCLMKDCYKCTATVGISQDQDNTYISTEKSYLHKHMSDTKKLTHIGSYSTCSLCCKDLSLNAPQSRVISQDHRIHFLTYNFFLRPPLIRSYSRSDFKEHRLKVFCESYLGKFDIIAFQEVFRFASNRMDRLITHARKLGYHYAVKSRPKNLFDFRVDAGLLIISKFPVLIQDSIEYKRSSGSDALSAKGALYALIDLDTPSCPSLGKVHLFVTHLQSTPSLFAEPYDLCAMVRLDQLKQLCQFIQDKIQEYHKDNPGNDPIPVIIAGDFNVNARQILKQKIYKNLNINNINNNSEGPVDIDSNISLVTRYTEYDRLVDHLNHTLKQNRYKLKNIFYEKYREHPVTFGNGPILQCDENCDITDNHLSKHFDCNECIEAGEHVCKEDQHDYPPYYDTILTHKSLIGSRQCIDYIFYGDPIIEDKSIHDCKRLNVCWENTRVEHFHVHDDPKITQLSDHYGLTLSLKSSPNSSN